MNVFELFGFQHWLAVGITVGLSVALPLLVRLAAGTLLQETMGRALALCLLGYLVIGPGIRAGIYGLPFREHLPLHLCGAAVTLGFFMLWLRSYRLYEVVYFWGTGGVLAALLTPDLLIGFPHPLFLLFFLGHGLALTAVMYATIVFRFQPRGASLPIALGATAGYALVIYPVNLLLGSNYLYLVRKPEQPSPLDYLGPWPWYVLGLAGLTLCVCLVCYLPFAALASLRRASNAGRRQAEEGLELNPPRRQPP